MASTEKLIIELDAKVNNLTSELDKVNSKLDETDKNTQGADKSLASFASTAKVAAGAAAAAVTAFTAFVSITAKSRQELQNLSATANESIANFEASAFALKNFGLEASDTAQLFNDIGEAASEFANVQSGPFQDLADQLGLTKNEAISLAAEVKELSGTDAMVRLINVVNEADLSVTDANQALKAISSDFQFLTPLVQDNAKSLETLAQRYNDANSALSLTAQQEKDLAALAQANSLLIDQLGNSAALISATVAPAFDDFFNAVIDIVPEATNTLIDFFNTFNEAQNINSISQINRQIQIQEESLSKLNEQLAATKEQKISFLGIEIDNTIAVERYNKRIEEETERLNELQAQQQALIDQQAQLEEVQGREGGSFLTSSTSSLDQAKAEEDTANQLAIIEERLKSEEQLLAEKLEREQEIVGNNFDLQVELYEEYLNNLEALDQKRLRAIELNSSKDAKAALKASKDKQAAEMAWAGVAMQASSLIFEDNKAAQSANAIVNTAVAVTEALPNYPLAAAVAASGAIQLAAINSASKGSSSSASASTAPSAPAISEIPEETQELSVSASDASGANVSVIKLEFDENTDLGAFLKQAIKTSEVNGTA